ncbi:flippase [Chryseobacterium sp. G0186]|uniref:oligosaccharide flippase family protein n=1 Tax=Chryseobacterium sp. G0186 TaxID=2487064 RepID=UPI000F4EEEBA|nr:oligosaccharide flippase family protein [Chryseobacterium sp. G0186]AZA77679.1 flippase [Chryseobacterium sp. G0186]
MKDFNVKDSLSKIKLSVKNNKTVVENYIFMTVFQILNSFFYILIYPYLIRVLGPTNYGVYVVGVNIATYFQTIITFGFDFPALKEISLSRDKPNEISKTFSVVFYAKLSLFLLSLIVFAAIIFLVPGLIENGLIYFLCFINIFSFVLYPQWYFQGLQRMKVVTIVQLIFKLFSLPFIFIFVKEKENILVFTAITVIFNLLSSLYLFYIILYKDKVSIIRPSINEIKKWIKMSSPFFASNSANAIKQQSTTTLIAIFFSTKDVALYDLAIKVFLVPTMITANINGAIFPKIVGNAKYNLVKKIIKYEALIGIFIILFLVVFGNSIITLLGGVNMLDAYPLLVAISFSVFTPLTVGAIMSFVFVPHGLYKMVAYNQTIAFIGYFIFIICGLLLFKSIVIMPLAVTFSAFLEIGFTFYILNKFRKKLYKDE